MMFLLLAAVAQAALREDFANIYYCPPDTCLGEKVVEPGWAGPTAGFRQCYGENDATYPVKTWNYYIDEGNMIGQGEDWDVYKRFEEVPYPNHPDDANYMVAMCCDDHTEDQCNLMMRMKHAEDPSEGCCYSFGFGAKMEEVSQSRHKNMMMAEDDKDMIGFTQCPVYPEKGFVGGGVKFVAGMSCKDLEENNWQATGNRCCRGLTAGCESCRHGITKEVFCLAYPKYTGCEDTKVCCRGMTVDCLKCSYDITEQEVCRRFPDAAGCESKFCCKAMTASCLACSEGMSVGEYCAENPQTTGCDDVKMCCRALTADCLSCTNGMTKEEYCDAFPWTQGCYKDGGDEPEKPDDLCCEAMTASCYACKEKTTVKKLCRKGDYKHLPGCGDNECCEAMTAECLACKENMSPEEWCESRPFEASCYAKAGEQCGDCYCPPTYKVFPSNCDSAHECVKNKMLPDLPGKCMPVLRQEGESCGSCYCPPNYSMGDCDKGLRCVHNPMIADAPGTCVKGMCCKAMTAKCQACGKGMSVDDYCKDNPNVTGCKGGPVCCQAMTADCQACMNNMTKDMFCKLNPSLPGCGQMKCLTDEHCESMPTDDKCAAKVCNMGVCEAMKLPCMVPPCPNGKAPKAVEGKCCEFEECAPPMLCKGNDECDGMEGLDLCDFPRCVAEGENKGTCMVETIACDQPMCDDGSFPDPIPDTCCEFEECPKAKKCKTDKQCRKLSKDPCEDWTCVDGKCMMAMIMCDMRPPCDNGKMRAPMEGTCCGSYPCDWDGDKCNFLEAAEYKRLGGKAKKECKSFGKNNNMKGCKYSSIEKKCWTASNEACGKFEGKKQCKKNGCKLKNGTCKM